QRELRRSGDNYRQHRGISNRKSKRDSRSTEGPRSATSDGGRDNFRVHRRNCRDVNPCVGTRVPEEEGPGCKWGRGTYSKECVEEWTEGQSHMSQTDESRQNRAISSGSDRGAACPLCRISGEE